MYCIPSPISLVIFLVFDAEVWEIFQEKQGSAFNQQLLNLVVLLCFFGPHKSVGRSLTAKICL